MSTPPPLSSAVAIHPAGADKLRLLGLLHLIFGLILLGFYSIPIVHKLLGGGAGSGSTATTQGQQAPEAIVAQVFIDLGIGVALVLCTLAVALIAAGWCLMKRRHRRFCLAVAVVEMIAIPIGTVLGVYSIVVLLRAESRALFAAR